jgi:protein-tyrosine phosphatase
VALTSLARFNLRKQRPVAELSLLLVCTANICRSPLAAGLLRGELDRAGYGERVLVESAGTRAGPGGEPADPRALTVAAQSGIDLGKHRSRAVAAEDFARFDRILAMDLANLAALEEACPSEHRVKLGLMLSVLGDPEQQEVPDPYYGNLAGFERVMALFLRACPQIVGNLDL